MPGIIKGMTCTARTSPEAPAPGGNPVIMGASDVKLGDRVFGSAPNDWCRWHGVHGLRDLATCEKAMKDIIH